MMGLGGVFLLIYAAMEKRLGAYPKVIDLKKLFEEMDRLRGDPIFPNGREQPPMQERDLDFDASPFDDWPWEAIANKRLKPDR